MPIEYDIIEEERLILAKGSGVVTGCEVLEHFERLAADERYVAPMKKLVDYRIIDTIRISQEEANLIARTKKRLVERFAGERCAFVAPSNVTYGTARVHQALIDGADLDTAVYRSIEEALEWLEIELDVGS